MRDGEVFTIAGVVRSTRKPDRRFKCGYRRVPTGELVKFVAREVGQPKQKTRRAK